MEKMTFLSYRVIVCLLAVMAMGSCKNGKGDATQYRFSDEKAVDLSDVLDIYHKSVQAKHDSTDYNLIEALLPSEEFEFEYDESPLIIADTAFAVQLPQYAGSDNPFLADAEVFYNSCLLGFNVWSNFELCINGCDDMAPTEDIIDGIRAISEDCIHDEQLRNAAREYKGGLLAMIKKMQKDEIGEDDNAMDMLVEYGKKVEDKTYKFYTDEDKFVDSLNATTTALMNATKHLYNEYVQCDKDKRIELILNVLNDCATFDEQCSLLLNWADSKEATPEDDEWIIAIAERLMNSGKYNLFLSHIWIMWRCMFQEMFCGISRFSSVPNDIYNAMRKKCYLTCLDYIEQHPDDVFAMNCAAAIGGRINMNRFGQFMFGNDAPAEKYNILPNRYDKSEDEE